MLKNLFFKPLETSMGESEKPEEKSSSCSSCSSCATPDKAKWHSSSCSSCGTPDRKKPEEFDTGD